jgi:hypothetical protein
MEPPGPAEAEIVKVEAVDAYAVSKCIVVTKTSEQIINAFKNIVNRRDEYDLFIYNT